MLDGDERASLAVTRSLIRAGCEVVVASRSRRSLAAMSRGAAWVPLMTSSLDQPSRFVAEVAALAARAGAQVLVPITDPSVEAVLEHRALLPAALVVPFADLATYRAASDKVRVHEVALGVGLGIGETVILAAGAHAPDDARLYPGVIKPHRSVVGDAVRSKTGVHRVATRAQCDEVLAGLGAAVFPVMLQRRVRGAGVGFFALRWEGRTIARFAHRRLREKPPAGGVSVLSESVALDPALQAACDALLERLGWQGVAMVECKEDPDGGGWRVIEINGRFWGSLQLAIDAGVDFPALLVAVAMGRDTGAPPPWIAGRRLRWEWGDVDHLLIRMRRSREYLSLPPEAPGRIGALARFFAHLPGRDRLELFRLSDPGPFISECAARLGLRR